MPSGQLLCEATKARTRGDSTLADFGKMLKSHQKLKRRTLRPTLSLATKRAACVSYDVFNQSSIPGQQGDYACLLRVLTVATERRALSQLLKYTMHDMPN